MSAEIYCYNCEELIKDVELHNIESSIKTIPILKMEIPFIGMVESRKTLTYKVFTMPICKECIGTFHKKNSNWIEYVANNVFKHITSGEETDEDKEIDEFLGVPRTFSNFKNLLKRLKNYSIWIVKNRKIEPAMYFVEWQDENNIFTNIERVSECRLDCAA